MRTIPITHRRAMAIVKVARLDRVPRDEERLLPTGAKLIHRPNGRWAIGGYLPDASDVYPYAGASLRSLTS